MFIEPEVSKKSSNVRMRFFGRLGGVSEGEYDSLNVGYGSGDDLGRVTENRKIIAGKIGDIRMPVCTVHQYHSNEVVVLEKPWSWQDSPQADAVITREKGIVIGALTADCVPILLSEPSGYIAAIHSGWKGAIGGIIENTIRKISELGGDIENITAAIGPAISQDSYEVGQELLDTFVQKDEANRVFFKPSEKLAKFQFDLKGVVKNVLKQSGVTDIELLPNDTLSEENSFFSFRRTTLAGGKIYGRQLSAIVLG